MQQAVQEKCKLSNKPEIPTKPAAEHLASTSKSHTPPRGVPVSNEPSLVGGTATGHDKSRKSPQMPPPDPPKALPQREHKPKLHSAHYEGKNREHSTNRRGRRDSGTCAPPTSPTSDREDLSDRELAYVHSYSEDDGWSRASQRRSSGSSTGSRVELPMPHGMPAALPSPHKSSEASSAMGGKLSPSHRRDHSNSRKQSKNPEPITTLVSCRGSSK